ncbi:MAG TPA: ATP-binding protein [Roseiflexaceae bacterium]|nr:ATP-binding protein [Roseiflexaceae bacterium]
MQTTIPLRRSLAPLGLGVLIALGMALLLAIGWLGARGQDMVELTYYLLASGAISLGCGALGLAWFRRGKVRLWLQVALTFCLGITIAILNIFLTANLMFISKDHDLPLLVLLLLFAAVVSLGLGYALAQALAQRVTALHRGARALAVGDLQARVDESGGDELAALAAEFNRMAAQLAAAADERGRLETARRELIAAISHDLRTPLASLRVMTEALADGLVEDPATTTRYLATMRGQIGYLSSLIDDLFELAQIDAGALRLELQRASLADLVSDAIESLQPQASAKGVRLQGSVAPGIGPALIAPQKIERVLYNLVTNAVRHTPAGGSVTISVTPGEEARGLRPGTGDHLQVSSLQPLASQRLVVVEVADTGEGIAPEDLPRIFEHFYRGEKSRSRATGGAGLGLAIAHGIVEAHGGRIWAESQPDRGTRIAFSLPLQHIP